MKTSIYYLAMILLSATIFNLDASKKEDSKAKSFMVYKKYQEDWCKQIYTANRIDPYDIDKTPSEICISQGSKIASHGLKTLHVARHLTGQFPLGIKYALYGTGEVVAGSSIAAVGCLLENRREVMAAIVIPSMIACMYFDKVKIAK